MASMSPEASRKLEAILDPMMATQPSFLGYPDETSQSSYYPGKDRISKAEIEALAELMKAKNIAPENTRLRKHAHSATLAPEGFDVFEIL